MRQGTIVLALLLLLSVPGTLAAQTDLAARMEVQQEGVQVLRVNTEMALDVSTESVVGVGDTLLTDATGRATILFFPEGVSAELAPNTRVRIEQFQGSAEHFRLRLVLLSGEVQSVLSEELSDESSFVIETPLMNLSADGTAFMVGVDTQQKTRALVEEGVVQASNAQQTAAVPAGFGIRSESEERLSDVVRADNFAQLDSALDGCAIAVETDDDVSINLRVGPSQTTRLVGFATADSIDRALGTNESGGWYRVAFGEGYAWFLSTTAQVDTACAGLRVFSDRQREVIEDDAALPLPLVTAEPTPNPTPEATAEAD